jgi:uncharacterized membrane protein
MKQRLGMLGGQLGIGLAVLGFILIFLGWNGAGTYDDVPAQFPYLISGGIAGLALVVLGAAFIVVDNQRRDRGEVQASLAELRDALDRLAGATASLSGVGGGNGGNTRALESSGLVVAGSSAYHRPSCRLVEGKTQLPLMTIAEAEQRGLRGCRTCDAAALAGVSLA